MCNATDRAVCVALLLLRFDGCWPGPLSGGTQGLLDVHSRQGVVNLCRVWSARAELQGVVQFRLRRREIMDLFVRKAKVIANVGILRRLLGSVFQQAERELITSFFVVSPAEGVRDSRIVGHAAACGLRQR